MKKTNPKIGPPGLTLAIALAVASSGWTADVITTDKINGYEGVLQGATSFVASGRPGAVAGNYALDLTVAGGGVIVEDASFLNAATAADTLSLAFWVKKYDMSDSSAFWIHATSEDRALQAHTPWSNDNVYFDTAGCCDAATQRINAVMSSFPGYTDASWWDEWHHFVFFKNGSDKQIWIDGQLFLQGENTAPLPTDITYLFLGGTSPGAGLMHGQMDDFAIFANPLSPSDIASLFSGTAPDALGGANQLLAYWDFDDVAVFATPLGFTFNVKDVGTTPMDPSTVVLSLDGTAVTPTSVVKPGSVTVIEYLLPNPPFLPSSTHSATVNINDTSGTPYTLTESFVVSAFGWVDSTPQAGAVQRIPASSSSSRLPGSTDSVPSTSKAPALETSSGSWSTKTELAY